MKKILLSIGVVLTSISLNAQIVNGDLTLWQAGEPSSWMYDFGGTTGVQPGTNNWVTTIGEGDPATTTEVTGAGASGGTGSSALLETKATVGASLIGAGYTQIGGMLLGEWTYTGTPASVSFDFIVQPATGDTAIVWVTLYDGTGTVVADAFVGWLDTDATTVWGNAIIPFDYVGSTTIAKVEVYCLSSYTLDGSEVVGSKLYVDNFQLNGTVASIEENATITASAFPNPASDVLNIKLTESVTSVSILGMDGKVLSTESVNSNLVAVNVSNLVSGVYFYEVVAENGTVIRNTFVKK